MTYGADSVAETVAFNDRLAALQSSLPPIETQPPEVTRAARLEEGGIFPPPVFLPQARWLEIPSRGGGLRVRVVAPTSREATGAYLHFHGGGWTIGAADGQDPLLEAIAEMTGLCAVSVEYRLAPEHPYPAGPDDCEDAALWLLDGGAAELGVPRRFAVGGESAGGHLSAVTLLRLRDRHGITDGFAAANLVFGAFDLTGTPSRLSWDDSRPLVLTNSGMTWFTECFLPGLDNAGRRDPDISPLYADLRGTAARAVHDRHGGPAARRLALHGCALAGRRQRRRAARVRRGVSRLHRVPARGRAACERRTARVPARRDRLMRVSAKVDYALRALLELAAAPPGPVKGERLATAQDIPPKFLENILTELRRAEIVASQRGVDGGYRLAKPAAEISVADVVRALEGPIASVRGVRPDEIEYTGPARSLQPLWVELRASMREVLEGTTLADLVERSAAG